MSHQQATLALLMILGLIFLISISLVSGQGTPDHDATVEAAVEALLEATFVQGLELSATADVQRGQAIVETAVQAAVTQTAIQMETAAHATRIARSATPTPTPTDTRVTRNDDWEPVERNFDGVTMVLVPLGCFSMGSTDGYDNERPVHEQCFTESFWIDKYEVSNAQYGSVGCASKSSAPDAPRNCVSWSDARSHCASRDARLPTEAEWEYAARGPDNLMYPWGNQFIPSNVVYGNNSRSQAGEVGSRDGGRSWVGALDMSGNLWEWTSSREAAYPYDADDSREEDGGNALRVLRGGSWGTSYLLILRTSNRHMLRVNTEYQDNGFRCVRSAD